MSEQAAPATRKYVILESGSSTLETGDVDLPPRKYDVWILLGTVEASTREKAIEAQANKTDDWKGGTLVAIPEGSWVPTPVKVETKRNVTLG